MTASPFVLRLPFTVPPVTANEVRQAHWTIQARAKIEVAEAVVEAARAAGVPPLERVAITLVWFAPDNGVRDCDGLYPMLKAAIDALTPARPAIPKGTPTRTGTPRKKAQAAKLGVGILPDDRAEIVESTTTRIVQADPDPRIELWLQPLPALPRPARRPSRRKARPAVPLVELDATPAIDFPVIPRPRFHQEAARAREALRAELVPAVQPADGGSAWRARVEAARGGRRG